MAKYGRVKTVCKLGIASSELFPSDSANSQGENLKSMINELVNEFKVLKVNMLENRRPAGRARCWNCNKEGHKRDQCPKNAQGSGKGSERQ